MVEILQYRRIMLKQLALCLLTSLMFVQIAEARIRYYKWEVKYEYKSPDCYKKLVITINGRSPGPTILAQEGDTVIVEVKNSLMLENLAIHWHGIRQVNTAQFPFSFLKVETDSYLYIHELYPTSLTHILLFDLLQIGTPGMDGTEGVTQCPVLPGDTFKYEFKVDRVGVRAPAIGSVFPFLFVPLNVTVSVFVSQSMFWLWAARNLPVPRALWNAKRSRALWINPCITCRWKDRTVCV
jgi:hypothetical protein